MNITYSISEPSTTTTTAVTGATTTGVPVCSHPSTEPENITSSIHISTLSSSSEAIVLMLNPKIEVNAENFHNPKQVFL